MAKKISSYLVESDIIDNGIAKKLVLSTRTGKMLAFKARNWEAIKKNPDKLQNLELIQILENAKFLVDRNESELTEIINENKQYTATSKTYYLVIQPSAACPLACHYCGQKHEDKLLSPDHQEAILQRVTGKAAAKLNISVGWYGGEPLAGHGVIKNLSRSMIEVTRAHGVHYNASITTNALLLSKKIAEELIHDCKVTKFNITLDGSKHHHDQRRHTKAKQPTFEKIYSNLKQLAGLKSKYSFSINLRANVDYRNKEGVDELLDQLIRDELADKVNFYVAPLHSWGNDAHKLAAEKQDFANWEIDWLVKQLANKMAISKLIPERNYEVCLALSKEGELVDSFGNVFNCTETSLVPAYGDNANNKYSLGKIAGKIDLEKRKLFGNFYHEIEKYPCHTCVMLPMCGGSCPKQWLEGHIPCPTNKYNINQKMALSYSMRKSRMQVGN